MLRHLGFVELPAHEGAGGFDHAAVHAPTARCYVAHTANDAVDVLDLAARRYLGSIPGLGAVAGALVSEGADLVFTSNRGENSVGVFGLAAAPHVDKIPVGVRPNGLAYDPGRSRLLVAHVGDPAIAAAPTVAVLDVRRRRQIADFPVPGRTRWAVFDPHAEAFHVNVADPPQIVAVGAGDPVAIRRVARVDWAGPHGLDIDVERRRLFCACDAGRLVEIDADTGAVLHVEPLAGVPTSCSSTRRSAACTCIGDPGLIEVFDTSPLRRHQPTPTEAGAHTLAFDPARNLVCAFLPATHRAAVYHDQAPPHS